MAVHLYITFRPEPFLGNAALADQPLGAGFSIALIRFAEKWVEGEVYYNPQNENPDAPQNESPVHSLNPVSTSAAITHPGI